MDEKEVVPGGPNDTAQHGDAVKDPADFFGRDDPEPEEGSSVLTEEQPAATGDESDAGGDKESEPSPEPEPTPEPTPEPESAGSAQASKKSGTVSRDYKIFVERRLSQPVLERLLKTVKDGNDGDVPIVYIELGAVTARNPEEALKKGFKQHRGELGEEATLAAPSANAFQPKAVRPRPPQPDDEQIEVG